MTKRVSAYSKVTVQGQTLHPPVTSFQGDLAMSCCMNYGVNLHTSDPLGYDLMVSITVPVGTLEQLQPLETYFVAAEDFSNAVSVSLSTTAAPNATPSHTNGTIWQTGYPFSQWTLGLCLEVDDPNSPLRGMQLYVPGANMTWPELNHRYQIRLLKDPALTYFDVWTQPIDTLPLQDTPLLDLGSIRYYSQSTGEFGLNPRVMNGSALLGQIGKVPANGLPFVIQADGAWIDLGAFFSFLSSVSMGGSRIFVEAIEENSLTMSPPLFNADPQYDTRVVRALIETGKLIP